MKNLGLLTIILLLSINSTLAQSLNKQGCATVMNPAEMKDLQAWVLSTPSLKVTATHDTIPLSIHLVGDNQGKGYYQLETLFKMLCNMNEHFKSSGMYFYIKWPIRYINNSNYYNHSFSSGQQMMVTNNIPNTINVYFVEDPAGACGYFSYGGDALAIKKNCGGINSTTLTHEIGHYFGLPHTFSGWENGNTPANPEKVTRGSGANCNTAGDYFCDTDADYLGERWNCPYSGSKLDANGDAYHPDSSLYMSYSVDACMDRFSAMQINRMQNRLQTSRANLLLNTASFSMISDSAKLIYPIDTLYANAKNLKWNSVPGADNYHVKVVLTNMPSNVLYETITSDTTAQFTANITNNYHITYSVAPLNGADVCRKFISSRRIIYSSSFTSAVESLSTTAITGIYPNPIIKGRAQLSLYSTRKQEAIIKVLGTNGHLVWQQQVPIQAGQQTINLQLPAMSAGLYWLKLTTENSDITAKLSVL